MTMDMPWMNLIIQYVPKQENVYLLILQFRNVMGSDVPGVWIMGLI